MARAPSTTSTSTSGGGPGAFLTLRRPSLLLALGALLAVCAWLANSASALSARASSDAAAAAAAAAAAPAADDLADDTRAVADPAVEAEEEEEEFEAQLAQDVNAESAEAEGVLDAIVDAAEEPDPAPEPAAGAACGPVTAAELRYTVGKIKAARLMGSPFPHAFIEQIYPKRVYDCMLANIPEGGTEGNGTSLVQTQRKPRFAIKLKGDNDRIMVSGRTTGLPNWKFWASYTKTFGSTQVARAWVQLFERTLKVRGIPSSARVGYSLDLNRDLAGYYIAPHTDSTQKVVTTLYYLPRDASNAKVGTSMFKALGATRPGAKPTRFKVVKQAKFLPNSVLAFAPCKSSWHGVEEKKMHQGISRDTVQAFVRMAGRTKGGQLDRCP